MSYILDALRKADQQRRQEAAPITLAGAPSGPSRAFSPWHALLALALLAAGLLIGWLRPWQVPAVVALPPPLPVQATPTVLPAPPVDPPPAEAERAPTAAPAAAPPVAAAVATPVARPAATPASKAAVPALQDLPVETRQQLPELRIALHAYAAQPHDRIVMINDQMLREGDQVAAGLVLEAITPDGVVLAYQGQRFKRGIR